MTANPNTLWPQTVNEALARVSELHPGERLLHLAYDLVDCAEQLRKALEELQTAQVCSNVN
jgi:hypothetical protein